MLKNKKILVLTSIVTLLPMLAGMGFRCEEQRSRNTIQVRLGGRRNTFYLFGGKDEGSAALIQGIFNSFEQGGNFLVLNNCYNGCSHRGPRV